MPFPRAYQPDQIALGECFPAANTGPLWDMLHTCLWAFSWPFDGLSQIGSLFPFDRAILALVYLACGGDVAIRVINHFDELFSFSFSCPWKPHWSYLLLQYFRCTCHHDLRFQG